MFEDSNRERLISLERHASKILEQFALFSNVRDVLDQWYSGTLTTLTVIRIDDYNFDATYLNTTVRFQLLFSYNKKNRASARVICLHKNKVFGTEKFVYLGDFSFDPDGYTTLPESERGGRTMLNSLDEVVVAYLDKAIQQGPCFPNDYVALTSAAS